MAKRQCAVVVNVVNATLSVGLGFGLAGLPALGVAGVAAATATANVLSAGVLLAAIYRPSSPLDYVRPTDWTVGAQLVRVGVSRTAERFVSELAEFPFDALLLSADRIPGPPDTKGGRLRRWRSDSWAGPGCRWPASPTRPSRHWGPDAPPSDWGSPLSTAARRQGSTGSARRPEAIDTRAG